MIYETIKELDKMLGNLDKWLAAATAFAQTKKFDPNNLLTSRLAPDQFTFARQVQSACDHAKFTVARLSGKEAPSMPDNEKTIDELQARIQKTREYMKSFTAKDFENAAAQSITQKRWEGKAMTGLDYLLEYALPNFYFHVTHAYAILRHNGVSLGKTDYVGSLTMK